MVFEQLRNILYYLESANKKRILNEQLLSSGIAIVHYTHWLGLTLALS